MLRRRLLMVGFACGVLWPMSAALAQTPETPAEKSLRNAIKAYVMTWNTHKVKAWSNMLTDDIWYTEADDFYQRMKGREAVLIFHGDSVKHSDIQWDVRRIKMMPDGSATVVLKHTSLFPPKKAGKYAKTFESDPSLSRWRLEGKQWKMFYFTSDKGTALDAMKKDGIE
jgi:ketosteroid isomerase-like protein